MSVNLLDMVKSAVAGQIGEQLGAAVGLDKSQTSSALNAALPVLLGGMAKKASSPAGAADLFKALGDQDTSLLGNLGSMLTGGGSSSMLEMGAKLLPMLLGASQGGVISALVKLLGSNPSLITKLLTMAAPIVMGVVAKQVKGSGIDATGLSKLMGAQSGALASALPNELKGAMGLADMLGGKAADTARQAAETAASPMKWLLPLAAVAAAAILGFNMLKKGPQPVPKNPIDKVEFSPPNVTVPTVSPEQLTELQGKLTGTFDGLSSALGGITDAATATDAVGKIKEAVDGYNSLNLDDLPATGQNALAPFVKPLLEKLMAVLDKAYLIPGVKDVVEPVIGPMVASVNGLID
jgi:hypothetical protein